jgi:predicted DNA-binding transcriptional regulator AlpA
MQRLLRTRGAAKYLALAESSLEKARLTGKGPRFVKLGRLVAYDIVDLDEWVNSHKRESTSEPATPARP